MVGPCEDRRPALPERRPRTSRARPGGSTHRVRPARSSTGARSARSSAARGAAAGRGRPAGAGGRSGRARRPAGRRGPRGAPRWRRTTTRHERRHVRTRLADARRPPHGRRGARRGPPPYVPRDPIVPRKLNAEDGEAARRRARCGSPTGSGGPCCHRGVDARDRSPPTRGAVPSGRRSSPSSRTPSSVENVTALHGLRPWQRVRAATTASTAPRSRSAIRSPWPDLVAARARGRGARLPRAVPSRDRRAGHARRADGARGRDRRLLLGTGVVPLPARTPRSRRWRRRPSRSVPAAGSPGSRHRAGGAGGARPAPGDVLARSVVLLAGESAPRRRRSACPAPASAVPIWIAALGPRAVRLAGEIADGVLLNWCTPERVAEARTRSRRGRPSRRPRSDAVTVAVYVRACARDATREALHALAAAAGEYASYPAYAASSRRWAWAGGRAPRRIAAVRDGPDALVRCWRRRRPGAPRAPAAYREAGRRPAGRLSRCRPGRATAVAAARRAGADAAMPVDACEARPG